MIKVNLLENDSEAKEPSKKSPLSGISFNFLFIVKILTLLFLTLPFVAYVKYKTVSFESELSSVSKQEKTLRASVDEKKKILDEKNAKYKGAIIGTLEKKISIIKYYSKKRLQEVAFLDRITDLIPEELWIDSINKTDKKIEQKGFALDVNQVFQFVNTLKSSFSEFVEVQVVSTKEVKIGNKKVFSYTLSAEYEPVPSFKEENEKKGKK